MEQALDGLAARLRERMYAADSAPRRVQSFEDRYPGAFTRVLPSVWG
jgi:hypothetical protein